MVTYRHLPLVEDRSLEGKLGIHDVNVIFDLSLLLCFVRPVGATLDDLGNHKHWYMGAKPGGHTTG